MTWSRGRNQFFIRSCAFADTNWGLPLAIAANLYVPYRIRIGHSYVEDIEDKLGAGKSVTPLRLNYI